MDIAGRSGGEGSGIETQYDGGESNRGYLKKVAGLPGSEKRGAGGKRLLLF